MIELNGHKFAENNKEFLDSLFHDDSGTCTGYYRIRKHDIAFMDAQKKEQFAITKRGLLLNCSPERVKGKKWYSYSFSYNNPFFPAPNLIGSFADEDAQRKAVHDIVINVFGRVWGDHEIVG